MRFYFASSSANWPLVRDWQEGARSKGHEISMDWTYMVEEHGRGDPASNPREMLKKAAMADLKGAVECDVFVLLWTDELCGALIETGFAIYTDTPVWIVAADPKQIRYAIFWELGCELMDFVELRKRINV